MHVIPLNSEYRVPKEHQEYARTLIAQHDERIPWSQTYPNTPTTITQIMEEIPVFLVDVPTQEEYGSTDILGFYCHNGRVLNTYCPVIGLCMERIHAHARTPEELKLLTTKVLIHEYAHALMATTPKAVYAQPDDFYRYMEEPLANMITMQYCNLDEPARAFAREFIRSQPEEYQLGADLYDAGIHQWWLWRNRKTDIEQRANKNQWLNLVSNRTGQHEALNNATLSDEWWNVIEPDPEMRDGIMLHYDIHAPLFAAARNGSGKECASILSDKSINPNIQDPNGWTPLFHAVAGEHIEACKALIDNGADVNHQAIDGCTPLHVAVAAIRQSQ